MSELLIFLPPLWFICGLYAWGTMMAHANYENAHRWPLLKNTSRDELGFVAFCSILGPIGAITVALITNLNQHGWELWEPRKKP